MYFKEVIEKYNNKNIELYVDMDGVIADYNVGKPYNFDKKRPLYSSLSKIEEVSKLENIDIHILSLTKKSIGIEEKNQWLDINAPFIKKENRHIISKEENPGIPSKELKFNYIKSIDKTNKIIILIDDDPEILKHIGENLNEIILLKDTVLVD